MINKLNTNPQKILSQATRFGHRRRPNSESELGSIKHNSQIIILDMKFKFPDTDTFEK